MTEKPPFPFELIQGGKADESEKKIRGEDNDQARIDVKNPIEKTVPDSESLFGVKEEPRQTVKEILKNDLGAEWKERVKDYNDVELTDDDAQLIAQAEIDMMNGQVKAFDRVKKQFPDLAHLFVEKEKEIRGEDEVHVQVVFYENFGKVDAVSTKIASNIVTHNLRIGDGVTIRGKLYRVVGEGYNFDHDGHKYGMLSLVSPELYDKKKERSPNKQNVFKIVDLDNYILPATEQGK